MIIKDKNLKKELDKIPDADQNGDPIYKIDASQELPDESGNEDKELPVFLKDNSDTPQGNAQDIKDSTEE